MTNRKQFDIIAKESLRGYGSVGRAMRSQRIGQGFESPYLHQNQGRVQSALFFDFGGDNAGQHTARFTAQGAQVCKANLMSRIKVFASTLCLNPYPLSDRHLSYERMIPLSPPKHARSAQVCKANLMSRIKAFADILCLNFNFLSYRQSKADRVRQVPRAKIKHNNREAYYASRLFCFPCSFILCFYMLSATSLSGVLLPKEACPCVYLAAVPAFFKVGNATSTKFHTLSSQPSVEVWNETDRNVVRSSSVPKVLLAVE